MPPCASKFMDPECHKCTLGKFEPLKLRVGVGFCWVGVVKELLCCCFRFGEGVMMFFNGMGKEN